MRYHSFNLKMLFVATFTAFGKQNHFFFSADSAEEARAKLMADESFDFNDDDIDFDDFFVRQSRDLRFFNGEKQCTVSSLQELKALLILKEVRGTAFVSR